MDLSPAARHGRDPGLFLWALLERVWVRCPRCAGAALVDATRRVPELTCAHCGYSASERPGLGARATGSSPGFKGPRCARCGQPLPRLAKVSVERHGDRLSRIQRCSGCGASRRYVMYVARPDIRDGVDPYFGLPLFLTANLRGHTLWAANRAHLELLCDYLGATLRKRTLHPHHMTMMARLPKWMKAAGARPAIQATLARLDADAKRGGLS